MGSRLADERRDHVLLLDTFHLGADDTDASRLRQFPVPQRLDRGGARCRNGGRPGEVGPELGLDLEVSASQVEQLLPLGHAEVGASDPPTAAGGCD